MGIRSFLGGIAERSAERQLYRTLMNDPRTMRDIGVTPSDVAQRLHSTSVFRL